MAKVYILEIDCVTCAFSSTQEVLETFAFVSEYQDAVTGMQRITVSFGCLTSRTIPTIGLESADYSACTSIPDTPPGERGIWQCLVNRHRYCRKIIFSVATTLGAYLLLIHLIRNRGEVLFVRRAQRLGKETGESLYALSNQGSTRPLQLNWLISASNGQHLLRGATKISTNYGMDGREPN